MPKLRQSQLKGLSEFLNTIAAAWFTAGVIGPLFVRNDDFGKTLLLAVISLLLCAGFLGISLSFLRGVKINA